MAIMEEVEKAKKRKLEAELHYRNSMPASSYQQQKLRVCEVVHLLQIRSRTVYCSVRKGNEKLMLGRF